MEHKFAPCTKNSVHQKRRWVAVVGDSLLGGTAVPISWPDVLSREVCCLLGSGIGDVTGTLPRLVQSTRHYLLLLFCMGTSDTGRSRLRRIRKDYRALGVTVRNFAELVFFSFNYILAFHNNSSHYHYDHIVPSGFDFFSKTFSLLQKQVDGLHFFTF